MVEKKQKNKKSFNYYRFSVFIIFTLFFALTAYVLSTAFIKKTEKQEDFGPGFFSSSKKQIDEMKTIIENPGRIAFKDKDALNLLCLGLDENRDH